MSSTDNKQSSGSPIVGIVVGVVLMVAGTYTGTHEEQFFPFQKGLREGQHLELNLGMTIATIGVFLILFPVINAFFLVPLQAAIQERNSNLESTFSEAEELKAEMQKMRTDYERRLANTEAQAREQIQSQIKEAQNLRATLMDEATQKTQALIAQAEQEIAAERDRLIGDLRSQVVDLALSAAEKVVRENMDTDRNRRIIEDFISRAEVVR
jgi:F-type H+-transporting ATPase subunit b